MKKTKEIDVWVSDSGLKLLQSGTDTGPCLNLEMRFTEFARFKHGITIKIPEPERKCEITEGQFDEMFHFLRSASKKEIVEKLFGGR